MTELDTLSALSPGAQLWLIPPLEQSAWATRIDWYLGFQMRRAVPHRRFAFSNEMQTLMEAFEDKLPSLTQMESSPLMVASADLLPNHQTVMVPKSSEGDSNSSISDWVKRCHEVWLGLNKPTTRIFLPKDLSRDIFLKAWPVPVTETDATSDLQFV